MPEQEKPSLVSKFLAINSKPTKDTFPELPDVIVWFRFALAVGYGTFLGLNDTHRSGGANVIFGLNFVAFLPILYCSTYLGANQESYDNKLLFAGVINSVALMLLIWVYLYTSNHESDLAAMASILSSKSYKEGVPIADNQDAGEAMPVAEESEF